MSIKAFGYLLIMTLFSLNAFCFDEPKAMSVEDPVAIPVDHQAILESDKVVSSMNKAGYFKKIEELREAELSEKIAKAQQGAAEANAAAKRAGMSEYEVLRLQHSDSTKEEIAEIENKKKVVAQQNARMSAAKSLLNSISVSLISNHGAMLNINGFNVSLDVGNISNGISLVSVNPAENNVVVSAVTTGTRKTIYINDFYSIRNTIPPVEKVSEKQESK